MKPVHEPALKCDESMMMVPNSSAQYILFHDDLVHGGRQEAIKQEFHLKCHLYQGVR
jgi:hypothetical protein